MARIKQGILGSFSGRVGNVVGSSWKGIGVMKSLPPSVSNPRSIGQTEQRNNMKGVVAFSQAILADVIKPLNDRFVSRQSGYNSFVSRNIKNFVAGSLNKPEDLVISPSLKVGQLIDAIAAEAKVTKVKVTWTEGTLTGGQKSTDLCYLVAWNADKGTIAKSATGITRDNEEAFVEFADDDVQSGDEVHVWMAFLSADGTTVFSTTHTVGTITFP